MPPRHRRRFIHHESPRPLSGAFGITYRPADAVWHNIDFHRALLAGGEARNQPHGRNPALGANRTGGTEKVNRAFLKSRAKRGISIAIDRPKAMIQSLIIQLSHWKNNY